MPTPPQLYDGDDAQLLETEGRVPRYPFLNGQVKDTSKKIYRRVYEIARSAYAPAAALATDPDDATAYLVNESDPVSIGGDLIRVERTYAQIPGDQVRYVKRQFTRPVIHDHYSTGGLAGVWAVSFDGGDSWLFQSNARVAVSYVATIPSNTGAAALPATNITFIEGAHTLNLAANSSAAAVVSAFNSTLTGLTSVYSNSGTGWMTVTWNGTMASITPPAAVLMTSGPTSAVFQATGNVTTPPSTVITAAGISAIIGDRAAFWAGNKLAGWGVVVSAPDANNLSVTTDTLSLENTLITHVGLAKNACRIVCGSKEDCTFKITDKFYLPGVTAGIATAGDIPDVTLYREANAWFLRILANTMSGLSAYAATNKIAYAGHPLLTGDVFWIIDLGTGASGLTRFKKYWVYKFDANNIYACATAADAFAGTPVAIGSDTANMALQIVGNPFRYSAVNVSQLESWMGPILMRTTEELDLANALEISVNNA